MSAELSCEHRKMLTETVVHGRIPRANDATGNDAPVPFDLGAAQALVASGYLAMDGESFVITEKGRHVERTSYAKQEGHARDEVPKSRGKQ